MAHTPTVRSTFLQEWARQLIIAYGLQPQESYYVAPAPTASSEIPFIPSITTHRDELPAIRPLTPSYEGVREGARTIVTIKEMDEIPQRSAPTLPVMPQPVAKQLPPTAPLNPLEQLINDPSTESLEYTGIDKPLTLKSTTGTKQVPLALTEGEVKKQIETMVQQAGTSIVNGIIRAETPTWSLFGVSSEFGGTRFLFQKKR